MELRSNRSRSKTPFFEGTQDLTYELAEESVQHVYSTRSRNNKSVSEFDNVFVPPNKQSPNTTKLIKRSSKFRQRTSDYSSEEEENEITSSRSVESENNAYANKTNGHAKLIALQVYKEAGEYWNKFPKTDYTYSRHSKDRFEVAPGVVAMPNMSRRSLHRDHLDSSMYSSQTKQQSYEETSTKTHYEAAKTPYEDTQFRRSPKLEPRKLFEEETQTSFFTRTCRTFKRVLIRIYLSIIIVSTIIQRSMMSSLIKVGKSYYKFVSRLLLFDTWLLLKNLNHRRLLGALLAIFMLPLFILFGWWLWSSVSNAIFADKPPSTVASKQENAFPSVLTSSLLSETKGDTNVEEIIQKLLENPHFERIIEKYIHEKHTAITQQNTISEMQNSAIDDMRSDMSQMRSHINFISASNARLAQNLNRCCRRQYIHIEGYVTKILSELIGKPGSHLKTEDFSQWLHTIFVAKQDLELALSNITSTLRSDFDKVVQQTAKKIMDNISLRFTENYQKENYINEITGAQIHKIVQRAIATYDADKTGMVDYALESSGGMVLSTRCTESYYAKTAELSIWGIPLWYPRNTPRMAITPDITPGNCWAFQGFPGFLVIQLSSKIHVSAFSLEHIPKTLAPDGKRDSATKNFSVYGLAIEDDPEAWLLGTYQYDHDGPALQYFAVQNEGPPFQIVELKIDSNHGHLSYTCLYRFRVHGMLYHDSL